MRAICSGMEAVCFHVEASVWEALYLAWRPDASSWAIHPTASTSLENGGACITGALLDRGVLTGGRGVGVGWAGLGGGLGDGFGAGLGVGLVGRITFWKAK